MGNSAMLGYDLGWIGESGGMLDRLGRGNRLLNFESAVFLPNFNKLDGILLNFNPISSNFD
jgi:hypothetical protein